MGANVAGAIIPSPRADLPSGDAFEIALLSSPLHTDIAVRTPHRLAFESKTLPLDHPGLRWLSYGWGSRAFYTTAGAYSDIELPAVWTAATGDSPVMRTVALGELKVPTVPLSRQQHEALLQAIGETFTSRTQLPGLSIGPDDAFHPARGYFHLFNPCNEWTRRTLNAAGIRTGIWTPTTFGLRVSMWLHGPSGRQP